MTCVILFADMWRSKLSNWHALKMGPLARNIEFALFIGNQFICVA